MTCNESSANHFTLLGATRLIADLSPWSHSSAIPMPTPLFQNPTSEIPSTFVCRMSGQRWACQQKVDCTAHTHTKYAGFLSCVFFFFLKKEPFPGYNQLPAKATLVLVHFFFLHFSSSFFFFFSFFFGGVWVGWGVLFGIPGIYTIYTIYIYIYIYTVYSSGCTAADVRAPTYVPSLCSATLCALVRSPFPNSWAAWFLPILCASGSFDLSLTLLRTQ